MNAQLEEFSRSLFVPVPFDIRYREIQRILIIKGYPSPLTPTNQPTISSFTLVITRSKICHLDISGSI